MRLKTFSPMGCVSVVLNDDATDEEIARIMMIAATTEPGNGSGRIFRRNSNEKGSENSNNE